MTEVQMIKNGLESYEDHPSVEYTVPCVSYDRTQCTLTLNQLTATPTLVDLNGLKCQLDSRTS